MKAHVSDAELTALALLVQSEAVALKELGTNYETSTSGTAAWVVIVRESISRVARGLRHEIHT